MPSQLRHDAARDFLLRHLNATPPTHWVLVCLGQGGRYVATEIRRRHYSGDIGDDWTEMGLPGVWLEGGGLLPIALGHRRRMTADELATVAGEFSKRIVMPKLLQSRRIIVLGDSPAEQQRDVLVALDKWLRARPGYERVGLE